MTTTEPRFTLPANHTERLFGDDILSRETIDGIEWVKVRVSDEFIDNGDPTTLARMRSQSDFVDHQLRSDLVYDKKGHLRPMKKPQGGSTPDDNEFSREIYRHSGMESWYSDTPSARALLPLHDPMRATLPGRADIIDETSRNFFRYSLDAQAIRARNSIVTRLSASWLDGPDQPVHVSYGSGLAVPVFEAFAQSNTNQTIEAFLVDNDLLSHDMARLYEKEVSSASADWDVNTQYISADLIEGLIRSDGLVDLTGRGKAKVVDVVGVAEYFPDNLAGRMLGNAYKNVQSKHDSIDGSGGVLLWGNMLNEHPQLAFNQIAIRWPGIHPRSRAQLAEIIDMIGAPRESVTSYVSEDGVYAVFEVRGI